MMMVVRILQKVTKDLEEHKQHCQEFFMRVMEKQKNYTICTQLTPSWVKFKLGLVQNLLYKEVNLRASIIQKGLNPLHTQ